MFSLTIHSWLGSGIVDPLYSRVSTQHLCFLDIFINVQTAFLFIVPPTLTSSGRAIQSCYRCQAKAGQRCTIDVASSNNCIRTSKRIIYWIFTAASQSLPMSL